MESKDNKEKKDEKKDEKKEVFVNKKQDRFFLELSLKDDGKNEFFELNLKGKTNKEDFILKLLENGSGEQNIEPGMLRKNSIFKTLHSLNVLFEKMKMEKIDEKHN